MSSFRILRYHTVLCLCSIAATLLISSSSAGGGNSCPHWTLPPPDEIWLEEGREVVIEMEAADQDSLDLLTLTCDEVTRHAHGWNVNTSPSNPVRGELRFAADSCDDHENGPDYTLIFAAADDNPIPSCLACTARTVIHIFDNDPPQITEVSEIPTCFHEGETLFIDVIVNDPDDYPQAPEGLPGEIEISYELVFPDPAPGPYDLDFSDNGDGTAVLRFSPHTCFVPAPDSSLGWSGYEYLFDIIFTASDKCGEVDSDTITVDVCRRFLIHPRTVRAYVGQQHVRIPFLLWNCDYGVAGWDFFMKYDDTAGRVIGVELCDSVYLEDPVGAGWYYSPWVSNADVRIRHFAYDLNPELRAAYLRVVGLLNLPGSQDTLIAIPPSEEWLLFCVIYEMSRSWDGHPVFFEFVTDDCPDNTLSDSTGYLVWGPDTLSAPAWTCPPRPDSLRSVTPIGGCGIVHQGVDAGDLNCNGISYEIGDAVVFVEYMIIGDEALCKGQCSQIPDCVEYQTLASDINRDEVYWNVSDLVRLLNLINGTYVAQPDIPGSLDCEVREGVDCITLSASSASSIGALHFVFDCPPGLKIGEPAPGPALAGMTMRSSREDGTLRILVYSPMSAPFETSGEVLFTIPVSDEWSGTDPIPLVLREVSASDPYGLQMAVTSTRTELREPLGPSSSTFLLNGNKPNPFQGQTTISFHLISGGEVTLRVYNSAGQLTSVLIDGRMSPGHHRVTWSPDGLPSGLYFYTLESGDSAATRRAVLIR